MPPGRLPGEFSPHAFRRRRPFRASGVLEDQPFGVRFELLQALLEDRLSWRGPPAPDCKHRGGSRPRRGWLPGRPARPPWPDRISANARPELCPGRPPGPGVPGKPASPRGRRTTATTAAGGRAAPSAPSRRPCGGPPRRPRAECRPVPNPRWSPCPPMTGRRALRAAGKRPTRCPGNTGSAGLRESPSSRPSPRSPDQSPAFSPALRSWMILSPSSTR